MRFQVCRDGNTIRGRSPASAQPGSFACTSSSLTANNPTITSSGGMPDSSSGRSKVKRVRPVTGSVPTVAIISPSTPAISPLSSDARASEVITLSPSTPTAK